MPKVGLNGKNIFDFRVEMLLPVKRFQSKTYSKSERERKRES